MLKLCAFLLFTCIRELAGCDTCDNNYSIDDTDLVMTFLVNRHGDRTPMKSELYFSNDPDELVENCKKYGYGELTDVGKARSFALGKHLRSRYADLLSQSYNSDNVYVESTDFTRTITSAKLALTGAYSQENDWSDDLPLVPIDCNVVPIEDSMHVAFMNCPKYKKYFYETYKSRPSEMDRYRELLEDLSDSTPMDLSEHPLALYSLYDLGVCQLNLGIPLCDIQRKLWDKMEEATGLVLDILEGNDDYLPLQAGGLLKDFHDCADLIIGGIDTPKFRLYSTHKFNVFSFLASSKVIPRQRVPKYCSVAGLELRRIRKNGGYVVAPLYISSPGEDVQYLEIDGCGPLCDWQKFKQLTEGYAIDRPRYKEGCKCEGKQFNNYKETCYDLFARKFFSMWDKFKRMFF